MIKSALYKYAELTRSLLRWQFSPEVASVAHHGIQRSGTNLLRVILEMNRVRVLNSADPDRNNPCHKHFRIQDCKDTIVMDSKYMNTTKIESIAALNELCGYPAETKHVVIFKPPGPWLVSISRWGEAHNWISPSQLTNVSVLRSWLKEWDSYYDKWQALSKEAPSLVEIINMESVVSQNEETLFRLTQLLTPQAKQCFSVRSITKVRHSSARTKDTSQHSREDIDRLVDGFNFQFKYKGY